MALRRGRGVGLRGLQAQKRVRTAAVAKGAELEAEKIDSMRKSMSEFKTKLEKFARKHKSEINKDPAFRAQFNTMCLKIGVDPLASNKGFWADLLGVGDFYYELSVQIVEVCLKTRSENGGLIDLNELLLRLREKRGKIKKASPISEDDIERAIDKVKTLGSGFGIITVGRKKMVKSVPIELNRDHNSVLSACAGSAQCTASSLMSSLKWPRHRVDEVLNLMLQEGMVWTDEQGQDETVYWVPSLFSAT